MVAVPNLPNNHPQNIPWETFEAVRKQLQTANQKIRDLEQENKQLKAEKWQRRELQKKRDFKPAEKLVITELQRQIEHPVEQDKEGFTRFCYSTAAINTGMSDSTPKRKIEAILEQWTDCPIETKEVIERTEDGKTMPRLYIKPKDNTNLIQAAIEATLSEEKIRKQGGNKYLCQKCGSTDVKIKRRLHCNCCGHEIDLEDSYPNGKLKNNTSRSNLLSEDDITEDSSNESNTGETGRSNLLFEDDVSTGDFFDESLQVDDVVLKPVPPPILQQVDALSQEELRDAQFLYMAIAGIDPTHIEMVEDASKYKSRSRLLTQSDIAAHINGTKTVGARCWYPGDVTRAFCKDADNGADLKRLEEGAKKLTEAGFKVLIEYPPKDRPSAEGWHDVSAHAWIVIDSNVSSSIGWQEIHRIAPEWQELKEQWPQVASVPSGNRVRLPGAKYVMPGYSDWCQLVDIATGESSRNGMQSAQLLLSHQTPAHIIQTTSGGSKFSDPVPSEPVRKTTEQDVTGLAELDALWEQNYGDQKLWFRFRPSYLVARFNEEHSPLDFLPKQRNGKAFSPNGAERTPSTDFYMDEKGRECYADFSRNGMRENGNPDTGDAFEAYCKVEGKTKWQALTELGKAVNVQARQELELAARQGQPIPAWVEEIVSEHGRTRYNILFTTGDMQAEDTIGGGTGFQDASMPVSKSGYTTGSPCPDCACELYRSMMGELACIRCFPKSGSKELADRLYPRKSRAAFGEGKGHTA